MERIYLYLGLNGRDFFFGHLDSRAILFYISSLLKELESGLDFWRSNL